MTERIGIHEKSAHLEMALLIPNHKLRGKLKHILPLELPHLASHENQI